MTCDLLLLAGDVVGVVVTALVMALEWMTLGLTFWVFGSAGETVAAAGVDCVFRSVRA